MSECIFCKINAGEIASPKVYEDDNMFIIKDIDPKAEKHYLAIPKKHYKLLGETDEDDRKCLAEMLYRIAELADSLGLKNGYRLVINQGDDAGQTVFHLHIHILGGQIMDFPSLKA